MTYNEFRKEIQVSSNRNHTITNSIGVYNLYKWIRKNKWLDIGRPLTEHEFYSIIRKVNNYLAESLLKGEDIKLPCRMGQLEIRKYDTRITIKNGKVKTNLPIDWDRTLRLWYDDEESFKKKTLVRLDEREIYKVYYNKQLADYQNMVFFEFKINRDIKREMKKRIKEGRLDAFKFRT